MRSMPRRTSAICTKCRRAEWARLSAMINTNYFLLNTVWSGVRWELFSQSPQIILGYYSQPSIAFKNPHAAADRNDPAPSAEREAFACSFKDGIHNMRLSIQIMPGNFTAPLAATAPLTQHHDWHQHNRWVSDKLSAIRNLQHAPLTLLQQNF